MSEYNAPLSQTTSNISNPSAMNSIATLREIELLTPIVKSIITKEIASDYACSHISHLQEPVTQLITLQDLKQLLEELIRTKAPSTPTVYDGPQLTVRRSRRWRYSLLTIQGLYMGLIAIPIPKLRWMIYLKLAAFCIAAFSMLGWCCALAGGAGKVLRNPAKAHGSQRTWLIIQFFMIGASSSATFATNAADQQRYASKPNDPILSEDHLHFSLFI